jgi:glycosyltransferase involved in cell wall biosynthesis
MTGTAAGADSVLSPAIPIVIYTDAAEPGGTTGYTVQLARGIRAHGYTVAAVVPTGNLLAPMRVELAAADVTVHAGEDLDTSPLGRIRRVRRLASIIRQYDGCVLALMMGYHTFGGPATLAGRLGRARAIVRADLQPPMPPISTMERMGVKLKDRLTDAVVVGARENIDAFVTLLGRRRGLMRVIHTGIPLERWQPDRGRAEARASLGYTDQDVVIGTTSRLGEERKGVVEFVEMAGRVARACAQARFLVVGEGHLRPRLEALAARLGLGDRIVFTGWRSDVPELVAAMDLFVMPSLFEGGPTSVLEAMAARRPVVATNVGMVPEVIEHGRTGLVVPPGNAEALAGGVMQLVSSDVARCQMAEAAQAHALRDFSIDRMVERYLVAFADVVR